MLNTIERAPVAQCDDTWADALAHYRKINDAFDAAIDRHHEAEEGYDKECPREDRFFDIYGLRMGMSRQAVIRTLSFPNSPPAVLEVAERIADEFAAYQDRCREASKRHRLAELDAEVEKHRPTHLAARDRLMRLPAPTLTDLIIKLRIAVMSGTDEHEQSAFDDADRLVGKAI